MQNQALESSMKYANNTIETRLQQNNDVLPN